MTELEPWTGAVHHGDAFDLLDELPAESAHAVVTDPPYGMAFMPDTNEWDEFESPGKYQQWCEQWAALALDVLKPGGHLLAFSGDRTHHRLFSGVEDAGFQIRHTLTWHYGQGFPKALDVAKAIDGAKGVDREVVGTETVDVGMQGGEMHAGREQNVAEREKTVATSAAAKEWDGFKTALKPATEFIVLARKPFDGTVAENVQAHGTAALNIEGCRIDGAPGTGNWAGTSNDHKGPVGSGTGLSGGVESDQHADGRYPANVILDRSAARAMDHNVGELPSGELKGEFRGSTDENPVYGEYGVDAKDYPADTGGPSRYFYIHGWDRFAVEWNSRLLYTSKATTAERTLDGRIENAHPTVKPIDLMEWLVRLVTAEGQTVLDPFAGTGTTGRAAKDIGRRFVLVERDPQWADVARARCGLTPNDPRILTGDNQPPLRAYTDGGGD